MTSKPVSLLSHYMKEGKVDTDFGNDSWPCLCYLLPVVWDMECIWDLYRVPIGGMYATSTHLLRLQQSSFTAATIQCCQDKQALKYNKKSGHRVRTQKVSCDTAIISDNPPLLSAKGFVFLQRFPQFIINKMLESCHHGLLQLTRCCLQKALWRTFRMWRKMTATHLHGEVAAD